MMQKLSKLLFVMLFVVGLTLSLKNSSQAFTIYDNYPAFLANFPNPVVENFQDSTLEPGLSVVSTYSSAQIGYGVYNDRVDTAEDYTTTWTNASGFTAFGGWFDLYNVNGPGSGIKITVVDTNEVIGTIPNTFKGEFWGFSTGYAFNSVMLSAATSGQETYMNIDLAYTPVPIPAAAWLLGTGLIGLIGIRRKFKK